MCEKSPQFRRHYALLALGLALRFLARDRFRLLSSGLGGVRKFLVEVVVQVHEVLEEFFFHDLFLGLVLGFRLVRVRHRREGHEEPVPRFLASVLPLLGNRGGGIGGIGGIQLLDHFPLLTEFSLELDNLIAQLNLNLLIRLASSTELRDRGCARRERSCLEAETRPTLWAIVSQEFISTNNDDAIVASLEDRLKKHMVNLEVGKTLGTAISARFEKYTKDGAFGPFSSMTLKTMPMPG